MSVRKKMRMTGDDTTSYSTFFEGLNEDQDHTPRKRTAAAKDHVIFSDDEEDAVDPFGYARNAVQRVFASTPLRLQDGESLTTLGAACQLSPERNIAKKKNMQEPLNSTANEWGMSLTNWDVSTISSGSSASRYQNVSYQTMSHHPNSTTARSTSEMNHKCRICERPFLSKRYATSHATTHLNKEELEKAAVPHSQCKDCNKIFFNKGNYEAHVQGHQTRQSFKCKECGKSFQRQLTLSIHLFNNHLTAEEKVIERRKWKYGCYFCAKRFYMSSNLEDHLRIHILETPFHCEECGIEFSQYSHLSSHKQAVHKGQKNINCPRCEMLFSQKQHMVRHLNSVHLKVRHTCKKCVNKSFTQVSSLQRHMKRAH